MMFVINLYILMNNGLIENIIYIDVCQLLTYQFNSFNIYSQDGKNPLKSKYHLIMILFSQSELILDGI